MKCKDDKTYTYIISKSREDKSASDIVTLLAGFIGGTITGALLWPVSMALYGHVSGVLIGACVAGLSGISIQNSFSQQDRPLQFLITLIVFSFLPFMFSLVIRSTKFEKPNLEDIV